jgi:hypothetical protein
MNLRNRLKKIEKAAGGKSEFCTCNGLEPIYKWTYADDGVLREPKETEADLCETCGKPTNRQLIIIDYVSDWKS